MHLLVCACSENIPYQAPVDLSRMLMHKQSQILRFSLCVASTVDDNLMWVEKYRPSKLDEIISHKNILESGAV